MSVRNNSIDAGNDTHKKTTNRKGKSKRMGPPTRGEALVKGVFMGIVISGVTHASKSITSALVRHPLALFTGGLAAGYLTHKYRKEILIVGTRTATESKNFLLRQKENLLDLVAESQEHATNTDDNN